MSVANIGKLQEKFHSKRAAKFRSKRTTFSQPKADFAAVQNFPSAWSDRLPMAITPSFQLRIIHRLKHWIVDFLSLETTYNLHKLNSRKAFSQRGVDFAEEGNFRSPFRSCEMGVRVLRSGTHVPKGGFAAAKHPAKWGFGCENWRFHALGISRPFHSCEMGVLCCEMALVCQEGVS
uniref:Uncharacterized protein n=1 Tax=Vitis vinifera TaxID=29760 RepID=A5AT94_VITVI|nr:hypothetical protein VITISV_022941 [Vitis vinifera]